MRALPQLVAGRLDARIDAVGHAARPVDDAAGTQLVVVRFLLQRAKVSMAARHRQHFAGVEEARRAHQTIGDRLGERIVAPADVAHGGEAAVERMREHPDCMRGTVRLSHRFDLLHRHVAAVRVHVGVDQTRHQRAAGDVDDSRVFVSDRLRRDFLNEAVGDAQVHALGAVGVDAVEDAGVFEQERRHRRCLLVYGAIGEGTSARLVTGSCQIVT